MASYKKEGKTWVVRFSYRDWRGKYIRTCRRGFSSKREAAVWYENFALNNAEDLNMTFGSMVENYLDDMRDRLRSNTMRTKQLLIEQKILPNFKDRKISEISPVDIRRWQSMMLRQGFKPTYLKTIHNQLSAIFNYAVRFYDLKSNPCVRAGSMGSKSADEKSFWTVDEFNAFLKALTDNAYAYFGFKILFWTGIRIGELLALQVDDFNFEAKTLTIDKSFQMIEGQEVITKPKTVKGIRVISLPQFLIDDLQEFFSCIYDVENRSRLFPYTKYFFEHAMKEGCKLSGVKKIRIHDLRHSHASLLVNMGLSAKAIADRLGHERIETTLNTYSHLYPSMQDVLVKHLEEAESGAKEK